MICSSCGRPVPPNESVAYRDRCEDCWASQKPSSNAVLQSVRDVLHILSTELGGNSIVGVDRRRAGRVPL